jgi:hypothetical protein
MEKEKEKPKSIRTIRRLRKLEPKMIEGVKNTLFLRGNKTSSEVTTLFKDLVPPSPFSEPSVAPTPHNSHASTTSTPSSPEKTWRKLPRRQIPPSSSSAHTARKDPTTSSSDAPMSTRSWIWPNWASSN